MSVACLLHAACMHVCRCREAGDKKAVVLRLRLVPDSDNQRVVVFESWGWMSLARRCRHDDASQCGQPQPEPSGPRLVWQGHAWPMQAAGLSENRELHGRVMLESCQVSTHAWLLVRILSAFLNCMSAVTANTELILPSAL